MTSPERSDLRPFFDPTAVAVMGSLREVPGTAFWTIRNMRHFGFAGPVYPINPNPGNYGDVLGAKVYSKISDVGEPIDLVVIITPPATIPDLVEECAANGVKAVIVMSEGFAESGDEGARLQHQLVETSGRTGIRIMGPNTFGLVNSSNGLVTVPPHTDNETIRKGGIALCSQTGSIGPHQAPLDDWAYPVSKICDIGNKCDVDEADILDYLASDPDTRVVAMHLEDIKDGPRFMSAARKLVPRKPLLILKAGRTEAGARASASHTGSLLGSDHIYDAALRQVGAIRVNTWQELWEIPKMFEYQPLPVGARFAIITITGGQGVIAADAAAASGLAVAEFSRDTVRCLSEVSPRLGGNPVDIGPVMSDSRSQSSSNPFAALDESLPIVLADPNVDCATVAFSCGQMMAPLFPTIVGMFTKARQQVSKPINVWLYGTSLPAIQEMARQLQAKGIPAFSNLDIAIKALGAAAHYSAIRAALAD